MVGQLPHQLFADCGAGCLQTLGRTCFGENVPWSYSFYLFHFHPYLGKIPISTNIFQLGWFNHQLVLFFTIFVWKMVGKTLGMFF